MQSLTKSGVGLTHFCQKSLTWIENHFFISLNLIIINLPLD